MGAWKMCVFSTNNWLNLSNGERLLLIINRKPYKPFQITRKSSNFDNLMRSIITHSAFCQLWLQLTKNWQTVRRRRSATVVNFRHLFLHFPFLAFSTTFPCKFHFLQIQRPRLVYSIYCILACKSKTLFSTFSFTMDLSCNKKCSVTPKMRQICFWPCDTRQAAYS